MNEPNIFKKALNYAAAVVKHVASGAQTAPPDEIERRFNICKQCPFFNGHACTICGCSVGREPNAWRNKIAMLSQECPIGKWERSWIVTIEGGRYISTMSMLAVVSDLGLKTAEQFNPQMIIGVARSGLIPATQLACLLHLPLMSVSVSDAVPLNLGTGVRGLEMDCKCITRALLVDDSCVSGNTLNNVKAKLARHLHGVEIATMAVYCDSQAMTKIDLPLVHAPMPHFFEWNWSNSFLIPRMAVDLDGLLCPDPSEKVAANPQEYIEWMKNVKPNQFRFNRRPVPAIVTMRPEDTRDITIEWLNKHRIYYDELHCWPGSVVDARRLQQNETIKWKSHILRELKERRGIKIYVDSHRKLAADIAKEAGPGIAGLGIY
jgi:hypoxanthine phosphoribosyltransferase